MVFEVSLQTSSGIIPSEWDVVRVKDVAAINNSTLSPKKTPKYINYIDISSVGERYMSRPVFMPMSEAPSRARRIVKDRDIIISTVRPNLKHYNYLSSVGENSIASTGFAVVSASSKVDSRFLYYYLTTPAFTSYLTRVADGGAYPAFNPTEIANAELAFPPLPEQEAIAHILSTLDDKIELNCKMNETLEAMARAIFKSWFVDFDPVRAKMEGRQPYGMDANTAALFPDSFQDSPLGKLPKGWKTQALPELVELIGGGTPKTGVSEYWGGDIPWFTVVDAPEESVVFVIDTEKHVTPLGVDNSSTKVLRKGTTIISARGTVGKCALVGRAMTMNQSCYGIQGTERRGDYFTYYTIRHQVARLQRSGHGSVFNTITRDTFKSIRLASPPAELTVAFDARVESLMKLILARLKENITLATTRDALLPKLLSGEIRVKDAEKFVEVTI